MAPSNPNPQVQCSLLLIQDVSLLDLSPYQYNEANITTVSFEQSWNSTKAILGNMAKYAARSKKRLFETSNRLRVCQRYFIIHIAARLGIVRSPDMNAECIHAVRLKTWLMKALRPPMDICAA